MIHEIEVMLEDGRWYFLNSQVRTENLGNEIFKALQIYSKVRVDGGKVYSIE